MSGLTKVERIASVSAAASHDLNDELTIIRMSTELLIRKANPGDPHWRVLMDLKLAADKCAWKTAGLLIFSGLKGAQTCAATLERMIEDHERK